MSPQLEALAMLNTMFESFDGRPVDQAILTRKDYALLAQALTARTHYTSPEATQTYCPADVIRDANRYRWLRDGSNSGSAQHVISHFCGQTLDEQIDGRLAPQPRIPEEK